MFNKKKNKLCVYHLAVGDLSESDLDEFINKRKRALFEHQELGPMLKKLGFHFVVIPNRNNTTGLEFINL